MDDTLRIAEIACGSRGGIIGVTIAPGKKQAHALSGPHERDLPTDLDAVAAWGAAKVVTLLTAQELNELGIARLGEEVAARFMTWMHLPIRDGHAPDDAFAARWPAASARICGLLERGERVLVHCKGGLGRAGAVAARLLVETGVAPRDAIAAVRRARGRDAIETRAQEAWVGAGRPIPLGSCHAGARDRAVGALLGLAIGDALGTTIEFSPKPDAPVLADMVGGGPFRLAPGQFTDDMSMALALAESLLAHPDLDARDLMNRFVEWRETGRYSCTGRCFDIGITTSQALSRFQRSGDPFAGSTDPNAAGNGSIMRLAPVPVRHWMDRERMERIARDQSRTTHGAPEAVEACATLAAIIADAIAGRPFHEIVRDLGPRVRGYRAGQPRSEVRGRGYVVASLHAALWSTTRTSTFEDAVLMAANLGEDADTTAAVAGQIAGAIYGASAIPARWLERLAWRDEIETLAGALHDAGSVRAAA